MTQPGETAPAERSERVSELSAAILRISASLDVKTVLQEAVDSASALTDARYGFVVTVDGSGTAVEVVSSGFTDQEHRQLTGWTDGPKLFERLRDLPGPIRLSDLPEFVRALGFSPEHMRSNTFQGMPMRQGGELHRALLSGGETRRGGIHHRGRGGDGAVRRPGSHRHSQRQSAP